MATIVVLNGTSSSGKTSIARAFQDLAPRLFLNFSIDSILAALPPEAIARMQRGAGISDLRYPELVRAFYACVRELAALGHDLIIDHAVMTREQAELLWSAVASHRALFAGLDCPLEVLQERERHRGDRRPGLAAAQCERIHQWLDYDLRIDTSKLSAEEAAQRIVAALPGASLRPRETNAIDEERERCAAIARQRAELWRKTSLATSSMAAARDEARARANEATVIAEMIETVPAADEKEEEDVN